MFKIKHYPLMNYRQMEKKYSDLNECGINYVCTSDLGAENMPVDIYYQEFPHPQFGNQYFGLFFHPIDRSHRIMNADSILDRHFGMVENDFGELEYSRQKNETKNFTNGNMISGGRNYIRAEGDVRTFKIQNGRFIETSLDPKKL